MNQARIVRERLNRHPIGRGQYSLTFATGARERQVVQTLLPMHYRAASGELREVDTAWTPHGVRLRMAEASFTAYATPNLLAAEVVSLELGGRHLGYKPLPLLYANAHSDMLDPKTVQTLAAPRRVPGALRGDVLAWNGAYGPGTGLEWRATPTGLQKWLVIDSPARFPKPLIRGPLALLFGFSVAMPDLFASLGGTPLDTENVEVDENWTTLQDASENPIFKLQRPVAVDAAGSVTLGKLKFRQVGDALVIAASFPLSWFISPERVYPVRIDPTVSQTTTNDANDTSWLPGSSSLYTTTLLLGTFNLSNVDWQFAIRWPGLDVPVGATVTNAVEVLHTPFHSGSTQVNAEVLLEDTANAAVIGSVADATNRPLQIDKEPWPLPLVNGDATTPSFHRGLQKVINKATWARLNAINIYHRDSVRNQTAFFNRYAFRNAVQDLNERPELSITYVENAPLATDEVTVTLRPRTSLDDGYSNNDAASFARSVSSIRVNDASSTDFDNKSFELLTLDAGQILPQGAVLKSADLIFTASAGASTPHSSKLYVTTADNPAAPDTRAAFDALVLSPSVVFTPNRNWVLDQEYRADVKVPAQSIVNRAGYSSGRMLWVWGPDLAGWGGVSNIHQAYSWDANPSKAVRLEIVYYKQTPPVVEGEMRMA